MSSASFTGPPWRGPSEEARNRGAKELPLIELTKGSSDSEATFSVRRDRCSVCASQAGKGDGGCRCRCRERGKRRLSRNSGQMCPRPRPHAAARRLQKVRTFQEVGLHQCPSERKGEEAPVCSLPVPSHVPSHPQTAAKVRGFSPIASGFTAETDWLLEEDGFEPSVPLVSRGAIRSRSARKARRRQSARRTPPNSKICGIM
jgi:hypothetical protein